MDNDEKISQKEVFILFVLLLKGFPGVTFVSFCLITDMNNFIAINLLLRVVLLYKGFSWVIIAQVVVLFLSVEIGKSGTECDSDEYEWQNEEVECLVDSVSTHYAWADDRLVVVERDRYLQSYSEAHLTSTYNEDDW